VSGLFPSLRIRIGEGGDAGGRGAATAAAGGGGGEVVDAGVVISRVGAVLVVEERPRHVRALAALRDVGHGDRSRRPACALPVRSTS
jgi:hypothetical protein